MKIFVVVLTLFMLAGCASSGQYTSTRPYMKYHECKRMMDNTIPDDAWGFPRDYSYCDQFKKPAKVKTPPQTDPSSERKHEAMRAAVLACYRQWGNSGGC